VQLDPLNKEVTQKVEVEQGNICATKLCDSGGRPDVVRDTMRCNFTRKYGLTKVIIYHAPHITEIKKQTAWMS